MSRKKRNVTPVTEPKVEISSRDAAGAIFRNGKKTTGKIWGKIKYAVIGVGSAAAGAAAGTYLTNKYALKQEPIELRLKALDGNDNVTYETNVTIDPETTTE